MIRRGFRRLPPTTQGGADGARSSRIEAEPQADESASAASAAHAALPLRHPDAPRARGETRREDAGALLLPSPPLVERHAAPAQLHGAARRRAPVGASVRIVGRTKGRPRKTAGPSPLPRGGVRSFRAFSPIRNSITQRQRRTREPEEPRNSRSFLWSSGPLVPLCDVVC